MRHGRVAVPLIVLLFAAFAPAAAPAKKMKFDEVAQIAPGVFFRYSAISPTNPNVFGGSNNIWIVFEDYVVVVDANFPKEAGDVIAAIRKTTKKPIRYVLDTHHHGDHAYGNAVWVSAGATIVSADALRPPAAADRAGRVRGRRQGADGPQGRRRQHPQAADAHLRRQTRPRRRQAARRVPVPGPLAHASATRSRICRSTRSSAPATPASTARTTSWAIPTPPPGFAAWRRCSNWT